MRNSFTIGDKLSEAIVCDRTGRFAHSLIKINFGSNDVFCSAQKRSIEIYIVVIAWLYVILMIAVIQKTLVAGVATFLFFGLAPCALLVWLIGRPRRPQRRRGAARKEPTESVTDETLHEPDRGDTKRD
jgi:hypothetical protein